MELDPKEFCRCMHLEGRLVGLFRDKWKKNSPLALVSEGIVPHWEHLTLPEYCSMLENPICYPYLKVKRGCTHFHPLLPKRRKKKIPTMVGKKSPLQSSKNYLVGRAENCFVQKGNFLLTMVLKAPVRHLEVLFKVPPSIVP